MTELVTTKEAAALCGVAHTTFGRWVWEGLISPRGRRGNSNLFDPAEAEVLGARHEAPGAMTRIWANVEPMPSGCLEWRGKSHRGYGRIRRDGVNLTVTRVVAEAFLGLDISDRTVQVCHHCDNPPCCNPMHLFLGSGSDNARDAIRKGRKPLLPPAAARGPRSHCIKGHDLSVTRVTDRSGHTACVVCRRERHRARRRARSQAAVR